MTNVNQAYCIQCGYDYFRDRKVGILGAKHTERRTLDA
jgi:hypothetical protein